MFFPPVFTNCLTSDFIEIKGELLISIKVELPNLLPPNKSTSQPAPVCALNLLRVDESMNDMSVLLRFHLCIVSTVFSFFLHCQFLISAKSFPGIKYVLIFSSWEKDENLL